MRIKRDAQIHRSKSQRGNLDLTLHEMINWLMAITVARNLLFIFMNNNVKLTTWLFAYRVHLFIYLSVANGW